MGSRCSVIEPTWAGQRRAPSRAAVPAPDGWLRLGAKGGWQDGPGSCCCVPTGDARGEMGSSTSAAPLWEPSWTFGSIRLRELGEMRAGSCNPTAHAARDETLEARKARRAIPRAGPACPANATCSVWLQAELQSPAQPRFLDTASPPAAGAAAQFQSPGPVTPSGPLCSEGRCGCSEGKPWPSW